MSYTILYEKPALKFIQKQPKEQQRRILEAVHALPDSGDIKQLKGHTGLLRLRVGSYRIIYTVDNGRLIVRIIDAGNRGQIYNRYLLPIPDRSAFVNAVHDCFIAHPSAQLSELGFPDNWLDILTVH